MSSPFLTSIYLSTHRMQRFRGGLVFKAHRLVYHSTLGLKVIKKNKKGGTAVVDVLSLLDEQLLERLFCHLRRELLIIIRHLALPLSPSHTALPRVEGARQYTWEMRGSPRSVAHDHRSAAGSCQPAESATCKGCSAR